MVSQEQINAIKLLACDVDGVLTDGTIIYSSNNVEIKAFHIKDGIGMKLARWSNFPVVWITGRASDAVARRAAELDVHLYQGMADKDAGLRKVSASYNLSLEEIAYVGDDLNDIPAMRQAGFSVAVSNSAPEVIALADYVTECAGGHGAIREVIEYILRSQGRWDSAVETYLSHLRGAVPAARMPRTQE